MNLNSLPHEIRELLFYKYLDKKDRIPLFCTELKSICNVKHSYVYTYCEQLNKVKYDSTIINDTMLLRVFHFNLEDIGYDEAYVNISSGILYNLGKSTIAKEFPNFSAIHILWNDYITNKNISF